MQWVSAFFQNDAWKKNADPGKSQKIQPREKPEGTAGGTSCWGSTCGWGKLHRCYLVEEVNGGLIRKEKLRPIPCRCRCLGSDTWHLGSTRGASEHPCLYERARVPSVSSLLPQASLHPAVYLPGCLSLLEEHTVKPTESCSSEKSVRIWYTGK